MKTRFTSIIERTTVMLLLMVLTTVSAWAQDPASIGSIQYNNTNSAYEINSVDNLNDLAVYVNGTGTYSTGGDDETIAHNCEGMFFAMSADIAYTGTNNFTPIGTKDKPFKGTFLGCGHKITGININNANLDNAGLFGVVEDATLNGVMIENASITAASNCGILVGYVKSGTTNTTIERCMTMGSVSGSQDVGGFAGVLASEGIIISECFAIGNVTASDANYANAGGFVGTIVRPATISDCYSLVTVKGTQRVGGFVGYMYNGDIIIMRCYAAGGVDGSSSYVGAFVGHPRTFDSITSCAALCDGIHAAGTNTAGTSETQDGVAELDAAGMKDPSNFPGWYDFEPAWTQTDGVTQPLLAWSVTNGLKVYASATGNGKGSVEVTADSYAPGSIVTINAAAGNNSFFDGWTGTAAFADPTKATTTIVLDNHHVVTAPFGKLIRIPAELQAVNDDLSGIYALAIDIDLGGIDWTSIGNAATRFTGKFYGRGHKILNMSCTKDPEVWGYGLFGGTLGATLDGITVTGTVSATAYFTGGLVGIAEGTLITNCHANCNVSNSLFHTGGLAGTIAEGTVVIGCSAEGTVVTTGDDAGGLVGSCGSGTVTIRDCVSSSEVVSKKEAYSSSNGKYIGGFIGNINSDRADISDCRADGYACGNVNGNVGGFVGRIGGDGTVNITDCVARGDVRSPGNRYGGFIGWANAANATISNCWCSGAVWGTGGYMGAFVGDSQAGSFENCRVYTYGPGPRLFSGSQTNLTYDALTATQVAALSKDKDGNPWPAVKKHTYGLTPIATAAQLQAVNNDLAGSYVLVDDIDLNGIDWTPIGNADTPFTGEFYGQGHKISNFTVNTTNQYAGLFGNIAGGRVSGVQVEEGSVSRTQDTDKTGGVGGFAGIIQSKSMVDDCSFMGTVLNAAVGKNGGYGGFVGRTDGSPAILRCFAYVESVDNGSSQPNTGGFVGSHGGGYIMDAYAIAAELVYGYANCVGGFAGYVALSASIANAWCAGEVRSQGAFLGAFVGQSYANALITNSYYDDYPNGGMLAQGTSSAGGSQNRTGITGVGDMSDPDNFPDFDFVATWTLEDSETPIFRRGSQHVTFDPAGGTCEMESHDYAIGGDYGYTGNDELPEPVRAGYLFMGWFDDLGFKVTDDSSVTIDANRTLHARWKKLLANTDITIDAIDEQVWTGNAITPAVTVKDGTKNISSECEFAYTNNQNTGTATVTITAKETSTGYSGSTTATFNIVPKNVGDYGAVQILEDQDGTHGVIDGKYAGSVAINLEEDVEVADVTFNRTFPTDGYSTIVLPFSVKTSELCGVDSVLSFAGIVEENGMLECVMQVVWEGTLETVDLQAYTPYIVRTNRSNISITGHVTFEATRDAFTERDNWEYRGIYSYKMWEQDSPGLGSVYGFAANKVEEDKIEIGDFVRVSAGAYIYPLRAYLIYSEEQSNAPRRAMTLDELPDRIPVRIIGRDGTGIVEMKEMKEMRNAEWYTLDGCKLNGKPTAKGMYIHNGKKRVIK